MCYEAIGGSDGPNEYVDDLTEVDEVERVVKSMLTENTGRHPLDSGDHYGRNHEENRANPPWERSRTLVSEDYVLRNVYHHLAEWLRRDGTCTRLERALYGVGADSDDSWLTDMKEVAAELHNGTGEPQVFNSYNHEFGALSQDIQAVGFETRGGSFVFLQVHGGCDIRGGYTKPRAFRAHWMEVLSHEFEFWCHECRWSHLESTLDYSVIEDMTRPEDNALVCPDCGEPTIGI